MCPCPRDDRGSAPINAGTVLLAEVVPASGFSMPRINLRSAEMMKRFFVAISIVVAVLFIFSPGMMLLYHLDHYTEAQ